MYSKIVFLFLCSIAGISCFTVHSSDERKTWLHESSSSFMQNDQHMKLKSSGEFFRQSRGSNEENGNRSGQIENDESRSSESRSDEKSEGLQTLKLKIKYSSSSSSEGSSNESHEIRQVQKQYHNTEPYMGGSGSYRKVMNLEATDFQNMIEKKSEK